MCKTIPPTWAKAWRVEHAGGETKQNRTKQNKILMPQALQGPQNPQILLAEWKLEVGRLYKYGNFAMFAYIDGFGAN